MEYLTTAKAGQRLGVSASRVRQLILAGRLPTRKLLGRLVLLPSDLKALKKGSAQRLMEKFERKYGFSLVTELIKDLKGRSLSGGVSIPKRAEVEAYLESFPDVAMLLPELCWQARVEFGPQADLTLELYRDPEIDDRCLILSVRLPRYDSNFMDRIQRVSRRFDDKIAPQSGYILLTTDFRPAGGTDGI
jgi:excisionase family DNA binding protein